jgi:SOS-response transcriptional repressor LexA
MSELYNHIDKLCKDRGINVTQLCREAKINRSTLSELNKGRTKTLSYTVSKKIADYFGIPLSEVYAGEEPKPLNVKLVCHIPDKAALKNTLDNVVADVSEILPSDNIHSIPIYESVSAGFGACANDCIVGYMPLFITSPEEAAETLIVRVRGDSMYPRINDGDLIQVHRQDYADNGQTVVMLIDGEEAVVKRYFCDAEHEEVRLESFNAAYAPRVFRGKDIERLRVLGVARRVIADL